MLRAEDLRKLEAIGQFEANINRDDVRGLYAELRGKIGADRLPHIDDLGGGIAIDLDGDEIATLLAAADTPVQRAAQRSAETVELQSATLVTWAAVVLGLAVLSKLRYDRQNGWTVEPGLPGLAEVLDKLKFPLSK